MTNADIELDDIASRALTSIILERTADAINDGGNRAAAAVTQLATDTGLVLDVCAAILMATSWLAGTGGIEAAAVFAAAIAFEPDAEEVDDTDLDTGD